MRLYNYLIASDIDGTFAKSDHQVNSDLQPYIDAIYAQQSGVALVSARMPASIQDFQTALGFTGPIVAYSGALVLDHTGNTLASTPIDYTSARKLIDYIQHKKLPLAINLYAGQMWQADTNDPRVQKEESIVHHKAKNLDIDADIWHEGIHKMLLMGDKNAILEAEDKLTQAFPELMVVRSSDILLEIMEKSVSKAPALALLRDYYHLDNEHVLVFGDGPNDAEMLKAFPRSYAMANAYPEAVAAAQVQISYSCDEAGVGRAACELLGIDVNHPCS